MYILLFLMILLTDQLTKLWALMELSDHVIDVANWFNLSLTYNKGVSFSFLTNDNMYMPFVLSGVALIIVLFLYLWFRKEHRFLTRLGLVFMMGGAISNVIDRLYLGSVVDFIDWHIGVYHWPAFNIADSFICLGVFLLIMQFIFEKKENKQ